MFNIKKYNKKMEKKNYEFKAFTSNGKEIELKCANIFYDFTEEEGLRNSHISACCRGQQNTCGGFKWRYAI